MIWKHKPGKKKRWLWVLLIAIPLALTMGSGFAEEFPAILTINPVPNIPQPVSPELPPGVYEGLIERVAKDVMVICDVLFRLAPDIRYLSEYNGTEANPSEFKVNTYVGYRLNVNDPREIVEIWLIKYFK